MEKQSQETIMPKIQPTVVAQRGEFFSALLSPQAFKRLSSRHHNLLPEATYTKKIDQLRKLGFENPGQLIRQGYETLTISINKIKDTMNWLRVLGFRNPHHMVMLAPSILYKSTESMGVIVELVLAQSLDEPLRVIESYPALLIRSQENVRQKIRLIHRLKVANVEDYLRYNPLLVGMDIRRIIPILKQCKEAGEFPTPKQFDRYYRAR